MDVISSRIFWQGIPMEDTSKKSEEKPSSSRTTKTLSAEKLQNHYDISFSGNFEQARDRASTRDKHLLVYIRDEEMQSRACKTLNEKVWSDDRIKQKLHDHFVFWQVSITDSAKLQKFLQTYDVHQSPFICILDPNTGKKLHRFEHYTRQRVLAGLSNFVHDQPSERFCGLNRKKRKIAEPSSSDLDMVSAAFASNLSLGSGIGDAPPGKRRCHSTDVSTDQSPTSKSFNHNPQPQRNCFRYFTRSVTNRVVGSRSVTKTTAIVVDDTGGRKRSTDDSDDESGVQPSSKRHSALGAGGSHHTAPSSSSSLDDVCEEVQPTTPPKFVSFIVRCVDGSRLSWKLSVADRIQNLMEKMEEAGFDRNDHDLIAYYPMRNVCVMSMTATLDSAGLNKQEVLYIREKDDDDE